MTIRNVKNYGAKGDGVTDDLPAITAAYNWTTDQNRGTLYFPPGTYYVSGPIDISGHNTVGVTGEFGASTIVGDFADYIFYRGTPGDSSATYTFGNAVENLILINNHAGGGGIRLGECVGAAIRNCDITADHCINTDERDFPVVGGGGSAYFGSLEVSVDNCHCRSRNPLAVGSFGFARGADGPTNNCSFKNFDTGMRMFAGQGAMTIQGCYFETNNYGLAGNWAPGQNTWNTQASQTGAITALGCHFKNNGTAILSTPGISTYGGIVIEASEGTIAGNPQYGVYAPEGGNCMFSGIKIVGQYAQAAFALIGGDLRNLCLIAGVSASNTSTLGGVAWLMPTKAATGEFVGCDAVPVFTMSQLPAQPIGINTASWSAGTTTLNMFHNMSEFLGATITLAVSGVTPSGYNGIFSNVTVTGVNTVTYSQSDPGSPTGSGGTAIVNVNTAAHEGDCYDVSDADTATWGGNPVGGGSTHAKVRWNGSNWTVMGK